MILLSVYGTTADAAADATHGRNRHIKIIFRVLLYL